MAFAGGVAFSVPLTRCRSFAIAVRSAGRRGDCDVRRFCQLGFPHSLRSSLRSSPFVSSFLVAAAALFVFVPSCVSDGVGVGAMRGCRDACGMAWCGHAAVVVAMGDLMMRCVWRSVRCGTKGETKGGTSNAPFLSARFGCSHVVLARRGVLGEFSTFSTVE